MSDTDDAVVYVLENVEEIDEKNTLLVGNHATEVTKSDVPVQNNESEAAAQQPIEAFSRQFLAYFEPDLDKINEKLSEVQRNQNVLIESLFQEKEKLGKCAAVNEVEKAMVKINEYRMKLCKIKKTMIALKEHSLRLRKDALRLQQIKQKENLKKEDVRHKVLAEERSLEARLSP